eukprot:CAMPEP_0168600030 /NCGR_PEP_ID=MMETSP0420-20121227/12497_1 /TAXON_ID=498008 /ORGANISM="Pessonella sp." /LENGTH=197 /DNA_ID=CAMNT_0008637955 /DNA_START=550 /DNA_END=1143 /DNA_ORIENTATION=-
MSTWNRVFRTALNDIDGSKLGIGLMSYDGKTNETIDEREIVPKFAELIKVGRRRVNSIAIWAAPIPDFWWRLAREWKRAIAVESRRQGTANLLSNGTTPHTGGCQATCDAAAHQECDDGICICSEGYFEVHNKCLPAQDAPKDNSIVWLIVLLIAIPLVVAASAVIYFCNKRHKRRSVLDQYLIHEDDDSDSEITFN